MTLTEPTTGTVTVDWSTADGTAVAGEDYVAASGTVTFAPGETTATLQVEVIADTVPEDEEAFSVLLSNATGGVLTSSETIITIADEDTAEENVPDDGGDGGESDGGESDGGDTTGDPAGGGDPVVDDPDTNGDGIYASVSIRETWSNGYVGDVFVFNSSENDVSGWTLELTLDAAIREIWNAEIVSQSGNVYLIQNIDVSASVVSDGQASFGFVADGPTTGLDVSDAFL